jgi:exodeoxyribonuclease-5
MLSHFLDNTIREEFPHIPTEQQAELIQKLGEFLTLTLPNKVFLLKGYAGTGKTTIISALVKGLHKLGQKTILMAPTGRAAKVLSRYSGFSASTIHRKIYRQKSFADFKFSLAKNLHKSTLFIVDEASMISNSSTDATFGSGSLLDDLIEYVYSGDECSLLILGDNAQLPPVEQPQSPALEASVLENYNLQVFEYNLTSVVRQALESGILYHATSLRLNLVNGETFQHPTFDMSLFKDVVRLSGEDLIDTIQQCYDSVGNENTIIVTRSNKRANLYNDGIRSRVLMREEQLSNGDLLMITKNNYFWNKAYSEIDFIANGDIVEVVRIGKYKEIYGFTFVDLTLKSLDYDWEISAKVWLEGLKAENPTKMNEMSKLLFNNIAEDYPEITVRRKLIKRVLDNPYFNALQVKFAYAVTCHKAQGGQWDYVFIDYSYLPKEQLNAEYYRWLYTAITRSTKQVYLVNFPNNWFI